MLTCPNKNFLHNCPKMFACHVKLIHKVWGETFGIFTWFNLNRF